MKRSIEQDVANTNDVQKIVTDILDTSATGREFCGTHKVHSSWQKRHHYTGFSVTKALTTANRLTFNMKYFSHG
jgi:hypothetical protein